MSDNPEPGRVDEVVRFLDWIRPAGCQYPGTALTAIPVGGGRTTTDTHFDAKAGAGWIASFAGRENCYYMVNPPTGKLIKKAVKGEVAALAFLHVDIDPAKGADRDAERARIHDALKVYKPRPSAVIDSGNGYQALWRIREPIPIAGEADWLRLEAFNKQLAIDLGGDSTHDVSRILRLPGLINLPDAKKRALGRQEQPTTIVWLEDSDYVLEDFTPARAEKPNAAGARNVALGEISRVDLDDLPATVTQRTRMLIVQGDDPDDPTKYGSKSEVMWAVTCEMVRAGCDDDTIAAVLLDPDFGISDHPLRQKRHVEYVTRQIERARDFAFEVNPSGGRVFHFASPYRTAQRLRIEVFTTTIHINDDWLEYRDGAYVLVENNTMRSRLYRLLNDASVVEMKKDGERLFHPFNPDPTKVRKVEEALKAVVHEEADAKAPPSWLSGEGLPPLEIISCRNGLLHLPSGELLPPTPDFFTRNALDIAYDPDAPEPVQWKAFLRTLWPSGSEPDVLQEVFGYLLLPDTSLQKIFLLVGPPRSGKGTILKLLVDLIGKANVAAPSISELGKDFGLEPLIGKQLAAITDMRLGPKADLSEIATNLLRISGEDDVSANRKGKSYWTGRLAVRFLILANALPKFDDDSPALSRRFVPLIMTESFLGREDKGLAERLRAELPGILNWAIVGWRRLRERGHFVLPATSEEAVLSIQAKSSPIVSFLTECCDEGSDFNVPKDDLYAAWREWCGRSGHKPGSKGDLTQGLHTARGHAIRTGKPGTADRVPSYLGVQLKQAAGARTSGGEVSQQYDGREYWR